MVLLRLKPSELQKKSDEREKRCVGNNSDHVLRGLPYVTVIILRDYNYHYGAAVCTNLEFVGMYLSSWVLLSFAQVICKVSGRNPPIRCCDA
jgi:hypothetical protein